MRANKLVPFMLLVALTGCNNANSVTSVSESVSEEPSIELTLQERLEAMNNVASVTEIKQIQKKFESVYLVKMTQQLDWEDPSAGTFETRYTLSFKGYTQPTIYNCSGYWIYDSYFGYDLSDELTKHYNGNFVDIEYRYFNGSCPDGFDVTKKELYQYLTSENAAGDFHNIVSSLSKVLTGPTIFTGGSKGGYLTEVQAMLYPDDCDAYVSYVAPLCDGINDDRFYTNIYETIGDEMYGQETAQSYRDLMLEFQVECLRNKTDLAPKYYEYCKSQGDSFKSQVTADVNYDVSVLEFACGTWQYNHNFKNIQSVLNMTREDDPTTSRDEKVSYLNALYGTFRATAGNGLSSYKDDFTPYNFQAYTEMGNYKLDFSYLRNELKKTHEENLLTITEEMESDPLFSTNMTLADEIIENFSYSPDFRNQMISWSKTTTTDVIKIVGTGDTWYAVRMPDANNEHISVYKVPKPHGARIGDLDKDTQDEIWGKIDASLKISA